MTQGGDRDKRTYIDPETNKFVTEESGRTREATPEEIEKTVEEWERYNKEGGSKNEKTEK